MAKKEMENVAQGEQVPQTLFSIEELREKHEIPGAVFEGMKAQNHWRTGKQVSEEHFLGAKKEFLTAPMDGRGNS